MVDCGNTNINEWKNTIMIGCVNTCIIDCGNTNIISSPLFCIVIQSLVCPPITRTVLVNRRETWANMEHGHWCWYSTTLTQWSNVATPGSRLKNIGHRKFGRRKRRRAQRDAAFFKISWLQGPLTPTVNIIFLQTKHLFLTETVVFCLTLFYQCC